MIINNNSKNKIMNNFSKASRLVFGSTCFVVNAIQKHAHMKTASVKDFDNGNAECTRDNLLNKIESNELLGRTRIQDA
jgi:hypothetical protein